jgi:hypothetical protein
MSDAYRLGEQASVASQLYGSMLPFAAASTMASAQRAGSLLSPLTVFHGSPHRFSKFDASKIGTGEGAQVYGHGLYFAENPGVAKSYQVNLTQGNDPRDWINNIASSLGKDKTTQDVIGELKKYPEVAQLANDKEIVNLTKQMADGYEWSRLGGETWSDSAISAMKKLDARLPKPPEGAFYKVDLPDEQIAKMLDWDKPLSQQPEAVQKLAKEFNLTRNASNTGESKGSYIYQNLATRLAEPPFNERSPFSSGAPIASAKLKELGIPGIRYLDQGSRGGVKGTSNFVVFPGEESKLKIMEVNGRPVVIDEEELRRSGLLGVAQ